MWKILGTLLVIWVALSIIGFVIKGLIWLAFVGIALFLVTALVGVVKSGSKGTP